MASLNSRKQGEEASEYLIFFHVLLSLNMYPAIFSSGPIFLTILPFAAHGPVASFSLSFTSFALAFLTLHTRTVTVLPLGHLTLLPPPECCLFTFVFTQELLVHPRRLPATFTWFSACRWHELEFMPTWGWRTWSPEVNQLSWTLLLSRTLSHWILPDRYLDRVKSALLKTRELWSCNLPCSLLSGSWSSPSHSHWSQGCPEPSQPWLLPPCL